MSALSAEAKARARDKNRRFQARLHGYAPPPSESECPPRPADGRCEYCRKLIPYLLYMDHNHDTGAFLAWCCASCNRRITDRIGDFGEPPPTRHRANYDPAHRRESNRRYHAQHREERRARDRRRREERMASQRRYRARKKEQGYGQTETRI